MPHPAKLDDRGARSKTSQICVFAIQSGREETGKWSEMNEKVLVFQVFSQSRSIFVKNHCFFHRVNTQTHRHTHLWSGGGERARSEGLGEGEALGGEWWWWWGGGWWWRGGEVGEERRKGELTAFELHPGR